jgi:tetratricopeptide (TPR) repeat protein
MPKARTAALKAIELDPNLAEAHVSLGSIELFYEYDWQGAEREMKRAIELKPGLAEAYDGYAAVLAGVGRADEAVAMEQRARDLDPLSALYAANAAWNCYLARRFDEAVRQGQQAVALNPELWFAHTMLGLAYEKAGRYQDAIDALNRARALDRSVTILEFLAGTYVAAGRKAEARKVLDELTTRASQEYVCPFEIATVHAALGDTRAALEQLEKGYEHRADCMPWLEADPKLDSLRQLPQFQDLRRRMGLER